MDSRASMQEESKDQVTRKKKPDAEEKEHKSTKVQMMMQPQDYAIQMVDECKQVKVCKIAEDYDQEMAGTKKTLKRIKIIKEELVELTETYQKNVLERTDELEQLGQLADWHSKEFSKSILSLSN